MLCSVKSIIFCSTRVIQQLYKSFRSSHEHCRKTDKQTNKQTQLQQRPTFTPRSLSTSAPDSSMASPVSTSRDMYAVRPTALMMMMMMKAVARETPSMLRACCHGPRCRCRAARACARTTATVTCSCQDRYMQTNKRERTSRRS